MIEKVKKNLLNVSNLLFSFIFACFYGLAYWMSKKVLAVATGESTYQNIDLLKIQASDSLCIFLGFIIGLVIYFVFFILLTNYPLHEEKKWNPKRLFLVSFLMSFLGGGLQLLVLNPGCVMSDSIIIINGALGMRAQHPLVYILYLAGIVRGVANITGSISVAMFVFSLVQLSLCSLIIAYVISWLAQKGVKKIWIIILAGYYSLFPMIGNYNITAIKDTVFGYFLVLVTISFYEIMTTKGDWLKDKKNIVLFVISFLGLSVVRNNGVYVCIVLLAILIFALPKCYKKMICIFTIVFFIINTGISKTSNSMPMESLAIPIQQTALTIVKSDDVTDEQKEIVSNMLPYKEWELHYLPFAVDTIKWDPSVNKDWLNSNNDVFVKNWLEMMPQNFKYYVEAFLYQTCGLWNTDLVACDSAVNYGQSRFVPDYLYTYTSTMTGETSQVTHAQILPVKVEQFLNNIYSKANFLGGGQCFWLMLVLCCVALAKKNFKTIWGILPTLGVVGTLFLSTPLSLAFRYTFFYVLVLPIMLLLLNINIVQESRDL